jgi:hypothetical protein
MIDSLGTRVRNKPLPLQAMTSSQIGESTRSRMNIFYRLGCLSTMILLSTLMPGYLAAQSREEKVRIDRTNFEKSGLWYYNNLEQGFEVAKKNNQPVLVVLRCIPCEECVKLDDEMLEANPRFQQLLKSFVRVRIVGTNGLDLSLFEFDTDQSFAVFIFGPDRTLYGRYGTRSDRKEWESDVSVEGMIAALQESLNIHHNYPNNREWLVGKQPSQPPFARPEEIPVLSTKFTGQLDYQGNVVKSCIHCHMIGEGLREYYRAEKGGIPEKLQFPFPHPKIVGLILDPHQSTTILSVEDNSSAKRAGFQAGDKIVRFGNQAVISMADIQWVLHQASSNGEQIVAIVNRDGKETPLKLGLDGDWKRRDDIAWRSSSWLLRRIGLGGLFTKPASDEERQQWKIPSNKMALVVQHVGAFAPHDRAKKAGLLKDDVLIAYDGRDDLIRETDLLNYSVNQLSPGSLVKLKVLRGSEIKEFAVSTADASTQ